METGACDSEAVGGGKGGGNEVGSVDILWVVGGTLSVEFLGRKKDD